MFYTGLFLVFVSLRATAAPAPTTPAPTPAPVRTTTVDVLKGAPANFKKDCHKNKKLPWNAPDNYLDCYKKPIMLRENKLDCCFANGKLGCCNPDDKFPGDANIIWSLMGIIGAILIILTWLYNWFNKDSFPCLEKYQDRIDENREKFMDTLTCQWLFKKPDQDDLVESGEPRKNEDGMEQTGHIPQDDFTPYIYSNAVF